MQNLNQVRDAIATELGCDTEQAARLIKIVSSDNGFRLSDSKNWSNKDFDAMFSLVLEYNRETTKLQVG